MIELRKLLFSRGVVEFAVFASTGAERREKKGILD